MSLFSCPAIEAQTNRITLTDPCFISDLHLSAESARQAEFFVRFLKEVADRHKELVILGDFFDYWVGDDAWETAAGILNHLRDWAQKHSLYLMHGNRDFMIGKTLADRLGATLLRDPTVAVFSDEQLLLSHGDSWCINDLDYQKVRRKVRSFWWQWMVLRLSLKKRLSIAQNARSRSKESKVKKDVTLMDIDRDTVKREAQQFKCSVIIHGHTHRPGLYSDLDNTPRYVLPDWKLHDDEAYRGGYLIKTTSGWEICSFR